MAKRCGTRNGNCPTPRANWWKQSLGVDWFNHNTSGGSSFDPTPYLDLINLQSINPARFSLSGSQITTWTEEGGTQWTQGTAANRPLLTAGVPTFDGSNDTLLRASDVSATTYSLYFVIKNTAGGGNKIFGCGLSTGNYIIHNTNNQFNLAVGGVQKVLCEAGMGTQRFSVIGIRRSGNTVVETLNKRTLLQRSNTLAGEATPLMGRLMSFTSGGFNAPGGLLAVCMSSQSLSDDIHSEVVDYLYNLYNLGSVTTWETTIGFGDSNTQNAGSWLYQLATAQGKAPLNLGVSGSLLTFGASNGLGRYLSQIPSPPYTDKVYMMYGTNDILSSVTASSFKAGVIQWVEGLVAQGYSVSDLHVGPPPYQLSGQNASVLAQYDTAVTEVKASHGIKKAETYTGTRDGGGDSLLTDAVHYNPTGQTLLRDLMLAAA